jgi:thiol:disulfide interchange protein
VQTKICNVSFAATNLACDSVLVHQREETLIRRVFIVGLITLAITLSLCGQNSAPSQTNSGTGGTAKFDPSRDPAQDLKAALAEAKATNKRILLDVGGQWCSWCKYFDRFFEEHADLRQFRDEHFVVMKVNFSRENENAAFLAQYPKIEGYPHLFVLDADGKLLQSQNTSVLEQGKGYNAAAVSKFMQKWAKAKKG